ncbi:GNAT family N-acetyltransferase [Paenibacillus barcinonensis]|uniref:Acetyltransferase (GNAT) family protein n=1 Tax=Paenibacillus barcinonensis TaxID=198119 RepID=A0A2V4WB57_PAEBA|nr:GNAT family N-acetyltransferase [Paenibacillus barcinonensis]PYE48598.1 acetyltransferase (GNAT) family protein [Paenibacillus barcinonensis]QKS58712.1 GNAT family N-acetyltransferase [Paenibacillus barcinonensis]
MFKSVENELEFAMFNGIWTTVWTEKGFELEFSEEFLERYVVVTEEGHYVGSIEIKPYTTESLINEIGPFPQHPLMQEETGRVAEIDKLAILSSFRGRYVADLLSAIVHYAEQKQISYYVMLLEPVLMRALRISYHVPIEKVAGRVFYKGEDVIPSIVNAREVYTHKERYPWLIHLEKKSIKSFD